MGLLDDAIRQHLDLKRRRGADPTEVDQAERDALGPVRRGPEGSQEADLEHTSVPGDDLAYDHEGEQQWAEPAVGEPDLGVPAEFEPGFVDDHHEPWQAPEPESYAAPEAPSAAPAFDEAEPSQDDEPGAYAASDPALPEPYAGSEPPLSAPEPEPYAAPEPSLSEDTHVHEPFADATAEHPLPPPSPAPPPPSPAPPPLTSPPPREPADYAGGETAEFEIELEEEPGADGEDVLEETPEFLQDTPDHDRLWFEQRPPKDFDFDG
jgi:hypothetical protein